MAKKTPQKRRRNKPSTRGPTAAEKAAAVAATPAAGQQINLSTEQCQEAAAGGLNLLSRESTLVPGSLRQQVIVLEVILQGLASGKLVVVTQQQLAVQSAADKPKT